MKRILAVSVVVFLVLSHSAKAEWRGTANFYAEPAVYTAAMQAGQLLSFGNPIVFRYWKAGDGTQNDAIRYAGIVQAISVEGTRRMQIHVYFSRAEARKAEGELQLEWTEEASEKAAPWWKFWAW